MLGGLPPKFGQQEKFGQSQFLQNFACVCACCFFRREFFLEVRFWRGIKAQLNSHETKVAWQVMYTCTYLQII